MDGYRDRPTVPPLPTYPTVDTIVRSVWL